MAVTTSTASEAIRTTYAPGFNEAVYRNPNNMISFFGAPVDSGGDTAYRWKINHSGNSSVEIYSEGQIQPPDGNQGWTNGAVSYLAFRFVTRVTGHARAALRSNWVNAIDEDQTLGVADLVDLITTTYMGSTYGIEAAIAATGTYAGITRGSAAYFESTSTAHSAVLDLDGLINLQEAIRDNDKGGQPGLIICPLNQQSNIWRLGGGGGIKNTGYGDAAEALTRQTFNGIPILAMPDWTDTVIAMLDIRPGHWLTVQHQPFMVHDQGRSADSDVYMTTYMGVIVGKFPRCDGKLTSVTA